jgi:ferrochelatase
MQSEFDAFLLVSFGGPEARDHVLPYLENVLAGKNVPEDRKLEVAEHYYHFGGVSPINAQNRALLAAIVQDFREHEIQLPVYWGNRNWHPLLPDVLSEMADDGIKHALALVTSPFGSYSSCRQYLENIADAQQSIGPSAPQVSKLRAYFNHPDFVKAWEDRAREAINSLPTDRRQQCQVLFTAHSIPVAMAKTSVYLPQLQELSRLVAESLELPQERWQLVFQSRSGPPQQPWLEPDVCDVISGMGKRDDVHEIVLVPIGFMSDHVEVLYDLDIEAVQAAEAAGVGLTRAAAIGTHPSLVSAIRQLVLERLEPGSPRAVIGNMEIAPDTCPPDCCVMKRPR